MHRAKTTVESISFYCECVSHAICLVCDAVREDRNSHNAGGREEGRGIVVFCRQCQNSSLLLVSYCMCV